MANWNLKARISEAIAKFEQGQLSFVALIDTVEKTGSAIEAIPYNMITELRGIVSRLAIEQGFEEEDCVSVPKSELAHLKEWLSRVPD
jgi:hypothetical protein